MDVRVENWFLDIRDAAVDAVSFVEGLGEVDFLKDKRTQNAVAMCLVRIGETVAKALKKYPTLRDEYPTFPWNEMKGFRNRIAHGYTDINFIVVWETVRDDLPNMIESVSAILAADLK